MLNMKKSSAIESVTDLLKKCIIFHFITSKGNILYMYIIWKTKRKKYK